VAGHLALLDMTATDRAGHLDGRHARGRRADARFPSFESRQSPGRPDGLLHLAPAEFLSAEIPIGAENRRGQLHLVIHGGDVLGRYADLDHLKILGRLEHPVPNLRRLNDAIARFQIERRSLILVHQLDPAVIAIDQLKAHRVIVDHIRHGSRVGNADVRRDDAAAEPAGNQIPILHARAADHPGAVVLQPAHDEGMLRRRRLQPRLGVDDLNAHPIGSRQLPPALGQGAGIETQQPQDTRRDGRAPFQPETQAVSRQDGHRRIVRREDHVQPEPQLLGVEGQIRREVLRWEGDLGRLDVVHALHHTG
jgi:hypothetical protein